MTEQRIEFPQSGAGAFPRVTRPRWRRGLQAHTNSATDDDRDVDPPVIPLPPRAAGRPGPESAP